MDIEIVKTLAIFSILQIGIWVFFLIKYKKANYFQRNFLLKLTIIFTIFITGILFLVFGRSDFSHTIANLSNTTILLVLPLFYIFIEGKKSQPPKSFWHFSPFVFFLVTTILLIVTENRNFISYSQYAVMLISTFYLQCIIYFIQLYRKSGVKLFSSGQNLKNENEPIYQWLRPFLLGFSIIILFKISIFVVWNIFQIEGLCVILCSAFLIASFTLINSLILFALLSKERIFQVNKYECISINNSEIEDTYTRLMVELVTNKEYLNPLINLNKLSKKTGIPANRISMVINEKTGKNFNELINFHRINDVKELMVRKRHNIKILDIAFEVGFNSKSTFNTAFKKHTGVTPSEFMLKMS